MLPKPPPPPPPPGPAPFGGVIMLPYPPSPPLLGGGERNSKHSAHGATRVGLCPAGDLAGVPGSDRSASSERCARDADCAPPFS